MFATTDYLCIKCIPNPLLKDFVMFFVRAGSSKMTSSDTAPPTVQFIPIDQDGGYQNAIDMLRHADYVRSTSFHYIVF